MAFAPDPDVQYPNHEGPPPIFDREGRVNVPALPVALRGYKGSIWVIVVGIQPGMYIMQWVGSFYFSCSN